MLCGMILMSLEIEVSFKSNICGAQADIIAEHSGEMESGFGISYVTKFERLDPEAIGKEAARRATELLGAKTIPSQKLPLMLDPFRLRTASRLLCKFLV